MTACVGLCGPMGAGKGSVLAFLKVCCWCSCCGGMCMQTPFFPHEDCWCCGVFCCVDAFEGTLFPVHELSWLGSCVACTGLLSPLHMHAAPFFLHEYSRCYRGWNPVLHAVNFFNNTCECLWAPSLEVLSWLGS